MLMRSRRCGFWSGSMAEWVGSDMEVSSVKVVTRLDIRLPMLRPVAFLTDTAKFLAAPLLPPLLLLERIKR